MLLRIEQVDDHRSMKAWRSPSSLRPLSRYNVIFGINGSGKSTIASLLYDACSEATWPKGLRVEVKDGEQKRTVSSPKDSFWAKIRVFDEEFVERNLRFSKDVASTAESLVILGEKRIDLEENRKRITARLAEIDKALVAPIRDKQAATKAREKLLTDTARTISEELQGSSSRYSPRSYQSPNVRELMKRGVKLTPSSNVSKLLEEATAKSLPELEVPEATDFTFAELLIEMTEVLQTSAISKVIKDFAEHPTWGEWAEQGLELHHDRTSCIYCGNDIDPDRTRELESHFDDSLRSLQTQISDLRSGLDAVRQSHASALNLLPKVELIATHLQKDYKAALASCNMEGKAFVKALGEAIGELDKKKDSLFTPLTINITSTVTKVSIDLASALVVKHNEFVRNLEANRSHAAQQVEEARVAIIGGEYEELSTKIDDATTIQTELGRERQLLATELKNTEVVELDALPLAEKLNADIAQLLGRSDLTFDLDDGAYCIKRNGRPASRLSEGERNAIALLYFLRSLEGYGTELKDCIVVIDDPVSSLDHNNFIGASSLLWSRLIDQCAQLVILTHDYELFRTWNYQLDALRKNNIYSLYELRPAIKELSAGVTERSFLFSAWPVDYGFQKRLRSEYHYLFWTALRNVHECLEDPSPIREAEAAIVLPNVCRRMLEAFLAFKEPTRVGDLRMQVKSVGPESIDDALRTRVLRFVHTYSHNEEADISEPIGRPESILNIRSVLEFMRSIDQPHFDSMCEALAVTYHPLQNS
jgi:wobble nucleotide-excising tRNase